MILTKTNSNALTLAKIAFAVAALSLSAQMKFYLTPVPFTLQTFALFVISFTLGARAALASVLAYIALGCMGAPVFANDLMALTGPSGGYILGFIPAAFIAARAKNNLFSLTFSMLFASAAIYAFGLAQLSFFVPSDKLFATGLAPFILSDTLKAIAAVFACKMIKKFK